jgi:hypothetical protein
MARIIYNNEGEEDEGGACRTNGEKRNAYRLLDRKARGKEATRKTKT